MTSYTIYEKGVRQTLRTWACQHHQGQLDEKHDRVPVLASKFREKNVLVPPNNESKACDIRNAIPRNQRHRWFGSLKSSQALTQSVFGALRAFDRLDLLQDVRAECGRPAFFEDCNGWTLCLEHEVGSLGEKPRGRTSVDVLLSRPEKRVAIECKFTEQEFGTCSRPRLPCSDEQHCDGNYRIQGGRCHRCALTEIGIRYWEHLPDLFDWPSDQDHDPCPFGEVYQLARNALAAALTPHGGLDPTGGHALIVYDARNPEFQDEGKATKQWNKASSACRVRVPGVPELLRRLSWQRLMAAFDCVPELEYLVKGVKKKYGIEPD